MSLVETDWLQKNLNQVKIIDCSWHMPQTKRNGLEEYKKHHIQNAIFFDLDNNSKKDTDLPHMLVDADSWEKILSNMVAGTLKSLRRSYIFKRSISMAEATG